MPIVPDTKDWTHVLLHPCHGCGFDAAKVPLDGLPELIVAQAGVWQEVLRRNDVRDRPDDATWAPLEYAAHVRDVHRIFTTRIRLMLTEDDPAFANWDQDETAEQERYFAQDPATVAADLTAAATAMARTLAEVDAGQWERTGRRSNGSTFTVDSIARYYLHDLVHHLHDVGAA